MCSCPHVYKYQSRNDNSFHVIPTCEIENICILISFHQSSITYVLERPNTMEKDQNLIIINAHTQIIIKQYESTVKVGIGAIVVPAIKNAASKIILKTFYVTKTTFAEQYQSTQMLCLKQEKVFRWLDSVLKIVNT